MTASAPVFTEAMTTQQFEAVVPELLDGAAKHRSKGYFGDGFARRARYPLYIFDSLKSLTAIEVEYPGKLVVPTIVKMYSLLLQDAQDPTKDLMVIATSAARTNVYAGHDSTRVIEAATTSLCHVREPNAGDAKEFNLVKGLCPIYPVNMQAA
jgi:hypothetical protein